MSGNGYFSPSPTVVGDDRSTPRAERRRMAWTAPVSAAPSHEVCGREASMAVLDAQLFVAVARLHGNVAVAQVEPGIRPNSALDGR